jgi:hypothetical protein
MLPCRSGHDTGMVQRCLVGLGRSIPCRHRTGGPGPFCFSCKTGGRSARPRPALARLPFSARRLTRPLIDASGWSAIANDDQFSRDQLSCRSTISNACFASSVRSLSPSGSWPKTSFQRSTACSSAPTATAPAPKAREVTKRCRVRSTSFPRSLAMSRLRFANTVGRDGRLSQ